MKLQIFQSSHGDCILLESTDGKRILCDGGMKNAMVEFVAPELDKMRRAEPGRPIDLVYVSHVDEDHISGVLQLLNDEAEWRVFDHHAADGDDFDPPDRPRPPPIKNLWHNAFRDQVPDKVEPIEDLLAAAAPALAATQSSFGIKAAFEMQQISLGVSDAIRVSKLVGPKVLNIPLNTLPGVTGAPKLLMQRPGQGPFPLGSFQITIVGPTKAELEKLREGWENWLDKKNNKETVKRINREIKRLADEFAASSSPQPISLFDWNGVPGFRGVTIPNVASLVLFVREGTKTLLLTGDAQHDVLLDQLEAIGLLASGHLHLDVLKVPHHGSENNMSPKFARIVSADHYVFCGNGESGNPERQVLQQIFDSRMSKDPKIRALAPQAQDNKRAFHFWFSTSSEVPGDSAEAAENFPDREKRVGELKAKSGSRLKTHFNKRASIMLNV
jgi:metallo-beta-lactamase superfamily protein